MTQTIPAPPGLSVIGQIAITVKDLPRAIAFYRDTLRVPFLFEAPPHLAFFDCSGVRLMLTIPEAAEFDHPASVIYFNVPNITESVASLKERGVQFEQDPHIVARLPNHDLWMAFLRDPERHLIGLMSEVAR